MSLAAPKFKNSETDDEGSCEWPACDCDEWGDCFTTEPPSVEDEYPADSEYIENIEKPGANVSLTISTHLIFRWDVKAGFTTVGIPVTWVIAEAESLEA